VAEEPKTILNDLKLLDDYIGKEVRQRMQEKGQDYGTALREYAQENPRLLKLREILWRREQRGPDDGEYQIIEGELLKVEEDIEGLIAEVLAKHPDLSYGEATRATLSERPEIWRRREELRRQLYG